MTNFWTTRVRPLVGGENGTAFVSVVLHEGEDVEWTYCHGKVVGYVVRKNTEIPVRCPIRKRISDV